jgi:hypothetical protein
MTLTSPPSLLLRSKMNWIYTTSSLGACMVVAGHFTLKLVCSLFNNAFLITRLYSIKWRDDKWMLIEKELEGSSHGLILRYYLSICPEGLRKNHENLRLAVLWTKIWTWNLLNMKQECCKGFALNQRTALARSFPQTTLKNE